MIKAKIISAVMSVVGISMIAIAVMIDSDIEVTESLKSATNKVNVINMSSSNRVVATKIEDTPKTSATIEEVKVQEVSMEQAPQAEYIPPRVEVYEGMTMEELAAKLDRNLGTSLIGGKGSLIAHKCIELGVDPYVAVAIMLHETGCKSGCSNLARSCNNVGGQKGAPSCNGGTYKAYATIDDGIIGHIENLYKRYYSKGLNTVETIAPKYAQSRAWPGKINWYVEQIRAS